MLEPDWKHAAKRHSASTLHRNPPWNHRKSVKKIRVAAISFLNPAPLLFDFEHAPQQQLLAERYDVHYTLPSLCAEQLRTAESDLGLVPIASLPTLPGVVTIPGCTIASLDKVRSIQLVVSPGLTLEDVRTVAADAASRSSAAYVRILLDHFYGCQPVFHEQQADLEAMLATSDAALLIGDPALLALDHPHLRQQFSNCTWIDVAQLWQKHTQLPWVAAVWAVRRLALEETGISAATLIADLEHSRDAGMAHMDTIVREWSQRLPLSEHIIETYLTENIHYTLDETCLRAIERFFALAEATHTLPPYSFPLLDPHNGR